LTVRVTAPLDGVGSAPDALVVEGGRLRSGTTGTRRIGGGERPTLGRSARRVGAFPGYVSYKNIDDNSIIRCV
jgi:hypothetical protein